ncbi:Calcium-transporting ATPase lmo0841 [Metamycoplasma cloacale]|uniref:Cation-translocating P-type ATPase n=1 Tax=Metamycoplasma cloacale TaxID=92401 RepID=A0A2Z4LMF9_9BACT|nr:cation-translocating P-type ATPase [Metamycoplasma cloacale]AWX43011.1 cation-translocating P-type ATPase [Metamycoplasma cloacale]VEU79305.1 Calcium-transporting ATPase lmo0841 [Metamycoplasma cloacale]
MKKNKTSTEVKTKVDVSSYIDTNIETGLTSLQASERQNVFGLNQLQESKKKNLFLIYLEQFKDLLVIILMCATLLSYILAIVHGVQNKWQASSELTISFIEPTIILFVVLTNSLVGAIQEVKSQKAIDALKKLTPLKAKVIRDGNLITINSNEITIGDIVFLEPGDVVPADGYLIKSSNLTAIESSLTGESLPSSKDANVTRDLNIPLAERKFALYSSSIIATGTAYFVVTAIGVDTEIGKIAQSTDKQKATESPLQMKINKLGKIFAITGIVLFGLSVITQIIMQAISSTEALKTDVFWSTTIINGVSLAVAAIPEGLIAFSSIILAIGVQRMAKRNAIVKDLMAVESLGSCAVICSDKTGTLTQNKMTVVDLYLKNQQPMSITSWNNNYLEMVEFAALCTEANLVYKDNQAIETGDPTEVALLYLLENHSGYKTKRDLENSYPRLLSLPFDSDRKLMTSINLIDNQAIAIVKGAPDVLLNKCNNLDELTKNNILDINNEWANKAYRVLAIAKKHIPNDKLEQFKALPIQDQFNVLENNLEFIGLIAMIDPPRESSKIAIAECKSAGIKPIMITGDNINTAIAIAKDLGIYQDGDLALTGLELAKLSDEELYQNIEKYSVYARVVPEDKLRIVKAWQSKHQIVAMTGDGVNDAPALKAAEIGCAMGITGTEASKQAADMILSDDNFATVVHAVENGRSIYQKIKNVIQNLLITSVAEIILVFLGLIIFKAIYKQTIDAILAADPKFEFYILSASQLLWINLFTHGFPAIALGLQDSKENYMNRRPISKFESIFANNMGINVLWQGILIGVLSMVGFYLGAEWAIKHDNPLNFVKTGSSVAFLILGIAATFNAINLMSKKPIIISNPFFYWRVYASVIFSLAFLLLVALVSDIARVFKTYEAFAQSLTLLAYGLGLPFVIVPIYFVHKVVLLLIENKKKITQKINKFELVLPPKKVLEKLNKSKMLNK